MTTRTTILATAANLLMLSVLYLRLFVGGIFADEQYNVYAARGDTDFVASVATPVAPVIADTTAYPGCAMVSV